MQELPLIASRYFVKRTTISVLNTDPVLAAKANPNRWAISFCIGTPNQISVSPFSDKVAPSGFVLSANQLFLTFKFKDYPAMVTSNWFAMNAGFVATDLEIYEELQVGST